MKTSLQLYAKFSHCVLSNGTQNRTWYPVLEIKPTTVVLQQYICAQATSARPFNHRRSLYALLQRSRYVPERARRGGCGLKLYSRWYFTLSRDVALQFIGVTNICIHEVLLN